jgi:hypothetical protein
MKKKKKEAANLARNKAKEQEKWGNNDTEPGSSSKENIENKFLDQFELLYSDDFDFSLEDAMLQLLDSSDLDMAEPESNHMVNAGKMIRVPRLLGAWIETRVDIKNKTAVCNCEDYSRDGCCIHSCAMETMVLKEEPNDNAKLANENWIKIREKCTWVVEQTYIGLNT